MLQTNERAGPSFERITRSVAANSPKLAPPSLFSPELKVITLVKTAGMKSFIHLFLLFSPSIFWSIFESKCKLCELITYLLLSLVVAEKRKTVRRSVPSLF